LGAWNFSGLNKATHCESPHLPLILSSLSGLNKATHAESPQLNLILRSLSRLDKATCLQTGSTSEQPEVECEGLQKETFSDSGVSKFAELASLLCSIQHLNIERLRDKE
jgi:hypothetical protein